MVLSESDQPDRFLKNGTLACEERNAFALYFQELWRQFDRAFLQQLRCKWESLNRENALTRHGQR